MFTTKEQFTWGQSFKHSTFENYNARVEIGNIFKLIWSFQIFIWGPKRWPTPTKLGKPSNFCFIKFYQNAPLRLKNPTWPTFGPPQTQGVRVKGVQPHHERLRMYTTTLILWTPLCSEWPWLQKDRGPGPSRFGFGSKKVTHPHLIRGALQLLFYKVFVKTHGWGSRGTSDPLYAPWTQDPHPNYLPAPEDHLRAKFPPDPSRFL